MRYLSRVVSEEKWNTGINILAKYGVISCPEYWKDIEFEPNTGKNKDTNYTNL